MNQRIARRINQLMLLALLLGLLSACGRPTPHIIEITHRGTVQPAVLVVPPGATVGWHNRDYRVHSLVAAPESVLQSHTAGEAVSPHLWASGDIASGSTWTQIMFEPGIYFFKCEYFPHIQGIVVVTENVPGDEYPPSEHLPAHEEEEEKDE
jgi:plastocyanin